MQSTLDRYGAGIQITQVQLQKVDPAKQVIDRLPAPTLSGRRTRRRLTLTRLFQRRAAVPRRSPRTPKPIASRLSPRPRARRPVFLKSTTNTRRRPRSLVSACIWKPWNDCSEAPIRSSWIPERRVALSLICRSTSSCVGRKLRLKREAGDDGYRLSQHELANLVGATRENVNKCRSHGCRLLCCADIQRAYGCCGFHWCHNGSPRF